MEGRRKKLLIWIERITWALLGLAVLSPLAHGTPTQLTIIAAKTTVFHVAVEFAFVLWIFLALSDKKYRVNWRNPAVFGVGALMLAFLVTLPFSLDVSESFWSTTQRFMGVYSYLHLGAFFVMLAGMAKTWKTWRNIFIAITGVALWADAVAIHQWWNSETEVFRVYSIFGNSLFLAQFITLAIFIGFILWARAKSVKVKMLAMVAVILHVFTIFLTVSRASWLALAVAAFIAVFVWFVTRKEGKGRKIVPATMIVATLLVIGAVSFIVSQGPQWTNQNLPFVASRVVFPTAEATGSSNFLQGQLADRDNAWLLAIDGFKERPVFGWGVEQFRYVFDSKVDLLGRDSDLIEVGFDRVHNQYLEVLVTTGIIGFAAYAFLWIAIFGNLHVIFRKERPYWEQVAVLFLFAAFVAHAVQLFFLFDVRSATQVFFLLMAYLYFLDPDLRLPIFKKVKELPEFAPSRIALALVLVALIPFTYKANVEPFIHFWKSNLAVKAIEAGDDQKAADLFTESVTPEHYLTPFLRLTIVDLTRILIDQLRADNPAIRQMVRLAVEETEKSLVVSPYRFSFYQAAAISRRQAADLFEDEAEEHLERAREIGEFMVAEFPGRIESYEELGEAELLSENYDEAIYRFEQAQELAIATGDRVTEGRHDFRMAEAAFRKGDYWGVVDKLDASYQSGYSIFFDFRLLEAFNQELEPEEEVPPAFDFYTTQLYMVQKTNAYVVEQVIRYFANKGDEASAELALEQLATFNSDLADELREELGFVEEE